MVGKRDSSPLVNGQGGMGSRNEVCRLQRRFKKGDLVTIKLDDFNLHDYDPHGEYAVVTTQVFKEDGAFQGTELRINSPWILKALRDIIGTHPSSPVPFDNPFTMEAPFIPLCHFWDELETFHQSADDDRARLHIGLLLDAMRIEMKKDREELQAMLRKEIIVFDRLWAIFRPGDILYKEERGHHSLFRCDRFAYEKSVSTGRRFEVHCTSVLQTGQKLALNETCITIYEKESLPGDTPRSIKSLPIYPYRFIDQSSGIEKALVERGQRLETFINAPVMQYDGLSEYARLPPSRYYNPGMGGWPTTWLPCTEVGRVVLDAKTFLEESPKDGEGVRPDFGDSFREWATKHFESLETAMYALCSPFVHGFSLNTKRWSKFYIPSISPVTWNPNAMDSLILPEREKSLIYSLVDAHDFGRQGRDVREQKGKGLVILLHGTPGSGKTMTAEVAAEVKKTSLMSLTMGELYDYGYFNELTLSRMLQYAVIFKSIVLIDEADIFLEARSAASSSSNASERNALVAVFLKHLEYFSGVLFLTSNRVEEFDAAVKSRIHLALQYNPPADLIRRAIWSSKLRALPSDSVEPDLLEPSTLASMVSEDLNGREITNSINTALTLARRSGQRLAIEHLNVVFDVRREFNRTLARIEPTHERRTLQHALP